MAHNSSLNPSENLPPLNFDNLQDIHSFLDISLSLPSPSTDPPNAFETLSKKAASLTGKHIPDNIVKANDTLLRAFASFVVEHLGLVTPEKIHVLKSGHPNSVEQRSLASQAVGLTRFYLFRSSAGHTLPNGYKDRKMHELHRINNALIEFMTHYKTQSGANIAPVTLKSYILSLKRAFVDSWGFKLDLLGGPVFADYKTGLLNGMDNKIREQKSAGVTGRSHNVLSEEDVYALYRSNSLSKRTRQVFVTRMIFNLAFVTVFRPTEILNLTWDVVKRIKVGSKNVRRTTGRIGSKSGASKTEGGGMRYVTVRPEEIFVWQKDQMFALVNVYDNIAEYSSLVQLLLDHKPYLRFYVAVHRGAAARESFFKAGNLGRNTILRYIKDACKQFNVTGTGIREAMTTHGLRARVITMLFESGHADSSVALPSGHQELRSLKAYQNLRGQL